MNLSNKKKSNSPVLTWSSSIEDLSGQSSQKAKNKSIEKLKEAGLKTLSDLMWVFPLRVVELPPLRSFKYIEDDQIFIGRAKVLNVQARPNFRARGKGRAMLYNIIVHVQDLLSEEIVALKWFNSYGSVTSKISKCTYIDFMGEASSFNGQKQLANPEFFEVEDLESPSIFLNQTGDVKIQYPTINTVAGSITKKFLDKIPKALWDNIPEVLHPTLIKKNNFINRSEAFKVIHGKIKPNAELEQMANQRLIYEEFYLEQIKIFARRKFLKKPDAKKFLINDVDYNTFCHLYPYELTVDQKTALDHIKKDFQAGHPMMRLIQGDVGCGKTSVAMIASMMVISKGSQVALMCPTEALALQHYQGAIELFQKTSVRVEILLGSTSAKNKKIIYEKLKQGEIDLIIGTHSLIQESVEFKDLGLAIIDEQHKFGVGQRLKLTNKGIATHCLIMSATPIPRSLSLTQYGDLDISIIKTMPAGRKGHKTRIVTKDTYQQYLNFINTRLSLNEQIYVVTPAINDNPEMDFHNLEEILEKYKVYFKGHRIEALHGQMKADEKEAAFKKFKSHEIDILVSTSVIEVGINVLNATVMAIVSPERFGLSSLHQLRGRVGRGDKPGFCFLVNDKEISTLSMERLKVIESSNDGFKIAEEDLKIRGEGDLFGTDQSGSVTNKKLANLVLHADVLEQTRSDLIELIQHKDQEILAAIEAYAQELLILYTV